MSKHTIILAPAALAVFALASCGDPDSPGLEYFPDMYRSPAVEAYVDYGQDPYYFGDSLVEAQRMKQQARLPVAGTIAFSSDPAKAAYNFPYPYPNTPEGYEAAGLGLKCPLPMSQENVDKGKVIFDKMCKHCHGEKGAGDGTVVANGGYPQPGAYNGPLKALPEGKIFHSITYGKNVGMGSHLGQLNKEERWLVTRYVQYLQNDGKLTASAAPAAADSTASASTTTTVAPGVVPK
ncbi:MAG: cytochrome c [Flavobacteriales bacterium]